VNDGGEEGPAVLKGDRFYIPDFTIVKKILPGKC
jgi:hypothetical protein